MKWEYYTEKALEQSLLYKKDSEFELNFTFSILYNWWEIIYYKRKKEGFLIHK